MIDSGSMLNRDRAKALIKERGRTKDWIASQCCVEPATLKHYLNGHKNPSAAVLRLMAQALEVPESELKAAEDTNAA